MKYKIIIAILTAFLGAYGVAFAQPAQYTPMTAQGYQMKRIKADSTLHIPSFCGTPTIKGSTAIDGAIAIDTCGNILYKWTRAEGWSQITGGGPSGIDSLKRVSDSIYARKNGTFVFQYKDSTGGTTIDTTSLSNRINGRIDSLKRSNDSIYARKNGLFVFQYKDSTGGTTSPANDTAKVVIAKVHNAETTTLTRGTVVYLFGANGDVASAKRANNKQDATSARTFGVVRRDIAAGDTGYIVTQGQIDKLNLGAYNPGDILWLDSLDGQFTKVKPIAPYHTVLVGITERANAGNGLAYIKIQNGVELDEIHDCLIVTPINNQVLAYSDTQQLWKNRNIYSIVDTTSLSNRINTKLNITDTNALARKQLPAFSFLANGTNAAANASTFTFKDTSATYTLIPTWNGSAPTGTTNHSYRWIQIGKMVVLNITLVYSSAGSSNSTLAIPFPTNAPAPIDPPGLTANNALQYPVIAQFNAVNITNLTNAGARGMVRKLASGYDIWIGLATSAYLFGAVTVTYFTNQ